MSTNGAPDSWEDNDDSLAKPMGSLNINAPTFVPNVMAAEFVPSWGVQPSPQAAAPAPAAVAAAPVKVEAEPTPVFQPPEPQEEQEMQVRQNALHLSVG